MVIFGSLKNNSYINNKTYIMLEKLKLTSVISKYYLNGMIEPVKWNIKDEELTIKFNAPTKDMIGKIVFKGMPLEDSTIAISNTTQLNKLIGIIPSNWPPTH